MAITRTAAYTATYTHTALIKLQVERVLRRSRIPMVSIQAILSAIDNKWINEVSVYGIDATGVCHAELYMKIDWARNQLHVSAGRDTVDIDARWHDGIAVETEIVLAMFSELISEKSLGITCRVRYSPGVDAADVGRRLGFRTGAPLRWRSGFVGQAFGIPEIDEFTVGIRISE